MRTGSLNSVITGAYFVYKIGVMLGQTKSSFPSVSLSITE